MPRIADIPVTINLVSLESEHASANGRRNHPAAYVLIGLFL